MSFFFFVIFFFSHCILEKEEIAGSFESRVDVTGNFWKKRMFDFSLQNSVGISPVLIPIIRMMGIQNPVRTILFFSGLSMKCFKHSLDKYHFFLS